MAGAAAAVRHDCRGTFHHRFPVRVRHVGDEHIALLDAAHFVDAADDLGGAGADLLADAPAFANHVRTALQREALDRPAAAALHGFRAGLQDIDLAVAAVLAPFDIHGAPVVLFDRYGHARQFDDVFVA